MIRPPNEFLDYECTTTNEGFRNFSNELFNEIGITGNLIDEKKEFLVTLLGNLKLNYDSKTCMNIPFRKKYYAKIPPRDRSPKQSFEVTKQIAEGLKNNGYIEIFKGNNETKLTTCCFAKPKLMLLLNNYSRAIFLKEKPPTFVVLRNHIDTVIYKGKKKKTYESIDYNNPEADIMNDEIKKYAAVREKSDLSLRGIPKATFDLCKEHLNLFSKEDPKYLQPDAREEYNLDLISSYPVRIFNNDFDHGGRFYRGVETQLKQRHEINNTVIKVKLRQFLNIDGNSTVELDYNAMHPRMLYHMEGEDYRDDPYIIGRNCDDNLRSIYKLVGMICINSGNEAAAIDGIQETLQEAKLTQFLPDNTDATRKKLIKAFARHNKVIRKYFFTGIGHQLQRIDSDIAHSILLRFARKGILVLCVHDSFIIESKYRIDLKRAMREIYFEKMEFQPKIK